MLRVVHLVLVDFPLDFFRWLIGNLIIKHMSWRMKRLIFVSSAFAVLKQISDPNDVAARKLNEILALAHKQDSCGFAMLIKDLIWKDLGTEPIQIYGQSLSIADISKRQFSEKERKAIGEYFVSKVPSFLRYGSDNLMSNEVAHMVESFT